MRLIVKRSKKEDTNSNKRISIKSSELFQRANPIKGTSPNEAFAHAGNLICTGLILFAINALSLNLGYISPLSSRFFGLLAIIAVLVLYINSYRYISIDNKFYSGITLIAVSLGLLLTAKRPELWLFSLPIFISGLDLVLRSGHATVKELPALSLGCIIYNIIYIGYNYVTPVWVGVRSASQTVSWVVGLIAGSPLNTGPTISGSMILLSFISFVLAFFILSRDKERGLSDLSLLLLFPAAAMAAVGIGYLLILSAPFGPQTRGSSVMDSVYLAFTGFLMLFLILFLVLARNADVREVQIGKLIERKTDIALFAVVSLSILTASINPSVYDGPPGKVVLYERDTEIGFDIPRFPAANESFEPYRGFSIGALGLFLKSLGYNVEELSDNSSRTIKDALDESDILVLLNLKKPFAKEDAENIRNFVKDGGALFVLGEHTRMFVDEDDFKSGRDYLNDILEPAGIRINSDTADYVNDHWKYANLPLPHYVTKNLGLDVSTSSVGASLSLNLSARPLIIGRYAFSDNPDPEAPGHLGNRTYEKGEELGDLVLGACAVCGKGKVLVIGDTSYMFNTEIPFRHKFIEDAVSWMMSERSDYLESLRLVSLLLLGILLVLYLTGRWTLPHYSIALQASISIMIALSLIISGATEGYLIDVHGQENESGGINLAFIDQSHLNRFNSANHNPDSIDGLIVNMMRNGYMPLVLREKKEISSIGPDDVLIIIAPTINYNSEEVSLINDFVKEGGLLIISAGYNNAAPLDELLRSFDLYINETPLGAAPWIVETHGTGGSSVVSPENLEKFWHKPKFMEAHPVGAHGDYQPAAWLNYEGEAFNLIVAKSHGKGRVVLIGDSHFLLNENLEYLTTGQGTDSRDQYQIQWLGNIELLREIIAKHKGKGDNA